MKVAVLGYAHVHAPAYAGRLGEVPGVTLAGVYDPDTGVAASAARSHGVPHRATLDEAIGSADAVVIAAPNADHHDLAVAALRAGRHVLCEKPLATRLEDADAMIAEARARGAVLATAFPMRFAPPIVAAYRAVRGGGLGRVLALSGANNGQRPSVPWFSDPRRAGGGAVMDHTVHLADLMRWLLDDEVGEVYAEVGTLLHDGPIDDVGVLSIRFAGGAVATIDASWNRPPGYPAWGGLELRIVAEHDVLDVDPFAERLTLYGRERAIWVDWGADADRAMLEAFVAACRGASNALARGEDGRAARAVANWATESAPTGRPGRAEAGGAPRR